MLHLLDPTRLLSVFNRPGTIGACQCRRVTGLCGFTVPLIDLISCITHDYSILAEPDNLSSTTSQLTNALTNLCTFYPTFSSLPLFLILQYTFLDDILALESATDSFSSDITFIQSSGHHAALVLEHS
jgi:hypothetical protein